MNDITIRFLEVYNYLVEEKKVKNASDFTKKIKKSSSFLTELKKGRSNVGIETLQSTVISFPEINANWVLTGEGEKVITEEDSSFFYVWKEMAELQKKHIEKLEGEINNLKKEFRTEGYSHRAIDEQHNL